MVPYLDPLHHRRRALNMLTLTLFLGAPAIDLGRAPLADEAVFDLGRGRLLQEGRNSEVWCKTHNVMPNGAFCTKKYAGMDKPLANALLLVMGRDIGDFGAGGGWYTEFFRSNGRASHPYDASPTRGPNVTYMDLSKKVELKRKFEWVLCLEVGEHISSSSKAVFLSNVASHARKGVVLSWAVPGQGGNGHVNPRPNKWVIDKMQARGFRHSLEMSDRLRKAASFSWFKDTLMVFEREKKRMVSLSSSLPPK